MENVAAHVAALVGQVQQCVGAACLYCNSDGFKAGERIHLHKVTNGLSVAISSSVHCISL